MEKFPKEPTELWNEGEERHSQDTSLKIAAIVIICLMISAVIIGICFVLFLVEDVSKYEEIESTKSTSHIFTPKVETESTEITSVPEDIIISTKSKTTVTTELPAYGYNDTGQYSDFGVIRVKKRVNFYHAPDACDREQAGSFPVIFFTEDEESYFMTNVNPTWWFPKECLDFYLGYKLAKDKMWISRDRRRFIDFGKEADLLITKPKVSQEEACLALDPEEKNRINNVPCAIKSRYFMCEYFDAKIGELVYVMSETEIFVSYRDAAELCYMRIKGTLAMPLNKQTIFEMWIAIPTSFVSNGDQILVDGYFSLNYETFYNVPISYESKRTKTKGQISDNCLVLDIKKRWIPVSCDSEHCVVCRLPDSYKRPPMPNRHMKLKM